MTLTCTDTISISVHAIVDNPAEAKLLEEFKAMCRKTVKFTYYEREPNWFSKLAKIADKMKGSKRIIDLLKKRESARPAFGEGEETKYIVFNDSVLLTFKDKSKWKIIKKYQEACRKMSMKEYGRIGFSVFLPRTKYYLDEKLHSSWG